MISSVNRDTLTSFFPVCGFIVLAKTLIIILNKGGKGKVQSKKELVKGRKERKKGKRKE